MQWSELMAFSRSVCVCADCRNVPPSVCQRANVGAVYGWKLWALSKTVLLRNRFAQGRNRKSKNKSESKHKTTKQQQAQTDGSGKKERFTLKRQRCWKRSSQRIEMPNSDSSRVRQQLPEYGQTQQKFLTMMFWSNGVLEISKTVFDNYNTGLAAFVSQTVRTTLLFRRVQSRRLVQTHIRVAP